MDDLAAIVRHVELKDAVWVGPKPRYNGPLQHNSLFCVVCRPTVVSERGAASDRKANTEGKKGKQFRFQGSPPPGEDIDLSIQVRCDTFSQTGRDSKRQL